MRSESDKPAVPPESTGQRRIVAEPDYSGELTPIAELLVRPDFPKSALGAFVDIGGYAGVVVEVVNQSLKVRSEEGATKSFNAHGLRRIYGRPAPRPERPEPAPSPEPPAPDRSAPLRPVEQASETPAPRAKEQAPVDPDFSKPVRAITEFVKRGDYPECVLREHVEINGYVGVVVQIVNRSLKIRSQGETTRSYNADALRKLHAG